jgi:hypothetical protein
VAQLHLPEPETLVPEQLATQRPVSTSSNPGAQAVQKPDRESIDVQLLSLQTFCPLFKAFGV